MVESNKPALLMSPPREWACPKCTLLNPMTAECCDACMHQQPKPIVAMPAMLPPPSDEPDIVVNPDKDSNDLTEPLINPSETPTIYVEYADDNEDPLQKKRRRRRRRRARMVLGGIAGLTIGAIVFCGPAGLVFGTIAGAAGARHLSKRGERKKDAHVARAKEAANSQQQNATKQNKPELSQAVLA